PQTRSRERFFVFAVEFITVPVTLADLKLAVDPVRQGSRLDFAGPGAQPHGAAQLFYATQFAQLIDHAVRRRGIELAGIGLGQTANVARELDARRLHPQADSKVRNLVFASILDRLQHALNATLAETARNQNSVVILKLLRAGALPRFQAFGLHPVRLQFQVVG